MKIDSIEHVDRKIHVYDFEKSVIQQLKNIKTKEKINFSIVTVDPVEVARVVRMLKQKGYAVSISSGNMTVQKL